jgi:phage shock protein C
VVLHRSSSDQIVAGVCGGLAEYLQVDSLLVRVAAAAVTIFTAFVPGLAVYLVLALLLDER